MSTTYNDHLKQVPMFADLTAEELTHISQVTTQYDAKDGEALMHEGGTAREMYIVINGTLVASVNGEELGTIGNGDFVGEMSLLAHRHRLVTVTAKGSAELLHIDGPGFASLLNSVPQIAVKMLPEVARHASELTARAVLHQEG